MSKLLNLGLVQAMAFYDTQSGETIIDADTMRPADGEAPATFGELDDDADYGNEDPDYGDRRDRLERRRDRNDNRESRQEARVHRRHDRREDRIEDRLERLSDRDEDPRDNPNPRGGWEHKPLSVTEAATSTSNQKVSIRVEDAAFVIENFTLDGTTAGVRIVSITVGPDTVFQAGGNIGLLASAFTGDKFAALKNLKGKRLTSGQSITVTFTPTAADDDLSIIAYGKAWRPVSSC